MKKECFVITRRKFLKWGGLVLGGAITSGIWKYILDGRDLLYAYPENLLSIDAYTKGKVKVGDEITMSNISYLKELLPDGTYELITKYGKKATIIESTVEPFKLIYKPYAEATEKNRGLAILDKNGQFWAKKPGTPWIGGVPFPEAKNALEVIWNFMFRQNHYDDYTWGPDIDRVMNIKYDGKGKPYGEIRELSNNAFFAIHTVGRIQLEPKPYIPGFENELVRINAIFYTPFDIKGLQVMNVQPYRGDKLNESYVYVPALKRVRRTSAAERFESPSGDCLYVSDYNGHNDSVLTWSYKLLAKKPMLASWQYGNFIPSRPKDETTFVPNSFLQLRPEVYAIEAKPTSYPRAPYSRKILYIDSTNYRCFATDFYDRSGTLWKHIEIDEDFRHKDKDGNYAFDRNTFYTIDFLRKEVGWKDLLDMNMAQQSLNFKVSDYFTPTAMLRLRV